MTDNYEHADLDAAADDFDEARLVYGGVLVEDEMTIIECVDHNAFSGNEEDTADVAMLVALASTREELGDFIDQSEEDLSADLGKTAAPHLDSPLEPTRVTDFDRAAELVRNSRACFLIMNSEGHQWNRVRDAYPDEFDEYDPLAGVLVIAFTLVEEARNRIDEQPLNVRTTVNNVVEGIDWS